MNNIDIIIGVLKQIEVILRKCGDENWLPAFERFIIQLSSHTTTDDQIIVLREIMGMYGGMGSFNDLVFFDGGKVCHKENERLDELRKELYNECRTMLTMR